MTYEEIGKKFNLDKSRICQIAKQIDKYLVPIEMDRIREIKVRHSQSLDRIFRKAMKGFEASQRDSIEHSEKETEDGTETTIKRKTNAGSPAFLSEARGALADIRKIWGADSPVPKDDTESRVAGIPHEQAVKEFAEAQIEKFRKMIEPGVN